VRHGRLLTGSQVSSLYARQPQAVSVTQGELWDVAIAIGALLYIPASRADLAADVRRAQRHGIAAVVLDLEDGVARADQDLAWQQAQAVCREGSDGVLVFVRPRRPDDVPAVVSALADTSAAGIVLAKADAAAVRRCAAALAEHSGSFRWVLPIVETREFLAPTTRGAALADLADAVADHRDRVLSLRLGGTDLSGLLGARREADLTMYEVQAIAGLVGDLAATFAGVGGTPVAGSVWEHLRKHRGVGRWRRAPADSAARFESVHPARVAAFEAHYRGLIREVRLDQANGLTGKSVIHPEHAVIVNALSAVSFDEWQDALAVQAADRHGGGASRSQAGTRMLEAAPHALWAARTMARARAFGVLRDGVTLHGVLTAFLESVGDPYRERRGT
jgi:citrate lyase beta subunit